VRAAGHPLLVARGVTKRFGAVDALGERRVGGVRRVAGVLDAETMERPTNDLLRELRIGALHDVGAKAGSLSGGQRQSMAIARAMLRAPRIVFVAQRRRGGDHRRVVGGLAARAGGGLVGAQRVAHADDVA
jgi:ABC-type uncharacterized transport system ATPase subunit